MKTAYIVYILHVNATVFTIAKIVVLIMIAYTQAFIVYFYHASISLPVQREVNTQMNWKETNCLIEECNGKMNDKENKWQGRSETAKIQIYIITDKLKSIIYDCDGRMQRFCCTI